MPKFPHLSGRDIIKALEKLGFSAMRQNGSHVVMRDHIGNGLEADITGDGNADFAANFGRATSRFSKQNIYR